MYTVPAGKRVKILMSPILKDLTLSSLIITIYIIIFVFIANKIIVLEINERLKHQNLQMVILIIKQI